MVAFLRSDEQWHAWAVEQFKLLPPKFITCEPVLTEACFLLGSEEPALAALDRFLQRAVIEIGFYVRPEWNHVLRLMRAYKDKPMSLADACLVRMSELHPESPVFSLDKHFRVYRRNGRGLIRAILPPV